MSLTALVFVAAFFGGLAMAFIRHPIYGLYTYVAVFYLHPPSRWWADGLPDLRWALLAAAVTFVATLRLPADKTRPSWASTTAAKLLIVYTAWLWIQNLWALYPDDQMFVSILFTKYLLLFYLIYRLVDTPKKLVAFLMCHVVWCGYLGWLAFNARVSGRLEGVGGPGIDEANALAMQMGTAVAVAAMLVLGFKGWVRWTALLTLPFLLNTMVLAGSRGAFVALLACGVTLWYLKPKRFRGLFYAYAALGCMLFLMLAHETFWGRVNTITAVTHEDAVVDRSASSRFAIIEAQWRMAKKYPFGAGHRGTAYLSPQYLDPIYLSGGTRGGAEIRGHGRRSSHNTLMTALVEQGIPGLIIYFLTWLWVARAVIKLKATASDPSSVERAVLAGAAGGGLTVVLVAGQFVDYMKAEIQIWLMLVLVVLLEMARASVSVESRTRVRPPAGRMAAPPAKAVARSTRSSSSVSSS